MYRFAFIVETSGFILDIVIIHVSTGFYHTSFLGVTFFRVQKTFFILLFLPVIWEGAVFLWFLVVWVLALALAGLLLFFFFLSFFLLVYLFIFIFIILIFIVYSFVSSEGVVFSICLCPAV